MESRKLAAEIESLQGRLRRIERRAKRSKSASAVASAAADLQKAAGELSSLSKRLSGEAFELIRAREIAEEERQRYWNLFQLAPEG
ncbi:MAG TPA: hypothetical protein VNL14_16105 [Candidatus Acidoferrales bacterium]|nr:hypothetical protein [Candidatus Acidoferrales bacterium]